jgi:hypothetical protein
MITMICLIFARAWLSRSLPADALVAGAAVAAGADVTVGTGAGVLLLVDVSVGAGVLMTCDGNAQLGSRMANIIKTVKNF